MTEEEKLELREIATITKEFVPVISDILCAVEDRVDGEYPDCHQYIEMAMHDVGNLIQNIQQAVKS